MALRHRDIARDLCWRQGKNGLNKLAIVQKLSNLPDFSVPVQTPYML